MAEYSVMTVEQKKLARAALGIDHIRWQYSRAKSKWKSFRNRYVCNTNSPASAEWEKMVQAGEAEHSEAFQDTIHYRLTWLGAGRALNPEEALDIEDFPEFQNDGQS